MWAREYTSTDTKKAVPLLYLFLTLIPFLYLLLLLMNTSGLPDDDYWYMIDDIIHEHGVSSKLSDWLAPGNEHIVLLSRAVYYTNILLTGGNNIVLSYVALSGAIIQFLLISGFIWGRVFSDRRTKLLAIVAASLFVFTPCAPENFLRGMSGVSWIGANTLSLLGFFFFDSYYRKPTNLKLFAICSFSVLAGLTYSSGVVGSTVLGLAGLCCYQKYPKLAFGAGTSLLFSLSIFLLFSARPERHGGISDFSIATAFLNLFFYFGGLFLSNAKLSVATGAFMICLFMLLLGNTKLAPAKRLAEFPFLILIFLYTLGNAAAFVIFRSSAGCAYSSRYGSLTSYLWFHLFIILLFVLESKGGISKQRLTTLTLGLVIAGIALYVSAYPITRSLEFKISKKDVASLSLHLGIWDLEIIQNHVTWFEPHRLKDMIPSLKKVKHIPFTEHWGSVPQLNDKWPRRKSSKVENWSIVEKTKVSKDVSRVTVNVAAKDADCRTALILLPLINQTGGDSANMNYARIQGIIVRTAPGSLSFRQGSSSGHRYFDGYLLNTNEQRTLMSLECLEA